MADALAVRNEYRLQEWMQIHRGDGRTSESFVVKRNPAKLYCRLACDVRRMTDSLLHKVQLYKARLLG